MSERKYSNADIFCKFIIGLMEFLLQNLISLVQSPIKYGTFRKANIIFKIENFENLKCHNLKHTIMPYS